MDGKHQITIRQLHDTTEGVRFLRATYTLATAFWTGFLFVFAVQILLFVFLDLAIQFGLTSGDDAKIGAGMGVLLSVIPFVHGLAAASKDRPEMLMLVLLLVDSLAFYPIDSGSGGRVCDGHGARTSLGSQLYAHQLPTNNH